MIQPAVLNLHAPQGATFIQNWIYRDDEGNVVDLTEYEARMQVRVTFESQVIDGLNLTTENGSIILGDEGEISIEVSATIMEDVPRGSYVYDFELIYPSGRVDRVVQGKFDVSRNVTR
jgi:hypothetical protein